MPVLRVESGPALQQAGDVLGSARLRINSIVEYDHRLWRVGLVNDCRARLDPITGTSVRPDPASGRCFTTYGDSVNIAPSSMIPVVSETDLDDEAARRLHNLRSRQGDGSNMAEAQVSAAPVPKRKATKSAKASVRAARPKVKREKVEREMKPCMCGCGEKTAGYFIAGHDARFKGWLLKIERGQHALHGNDIGKEQERTPLPRKVQEQFKWVGCGNGGFRPTTDYRGNPHKGYDKG
jgi:ribosomal protein S27AE